MAKSKFSVKLLLIQFAFLIIGALLTGFFTVFFAKFFERYIPQSFAVAFGAGAGVALTLWFTQWVNNPPFLLKGVSPLIAGFCAALGVHTARTWLS